MYAIALNDCPPAELVRQNKRQMIRRLAAVSTFDHGRNGKKVGAYAMKRVAAGAHLLNSWFFSLETPT